MFTSGSDLDFAHTAAIPVQVEAVSSHGSHTRLHDGGYRVDRQHPIRQASFRRYCTSDPATPGRPAPLPRSSVRPTWSRSMLRSCYQLRDRFVFSATSWSELTGYQNKDNFSIFQWVLCLTGGWERRGPWGRPTGTRCQTATRAAKVGGWII